MAERHGTTARIVRDVFTPETLDRCFVIAAQILMTAMPTLIAVTAFVPDAIRDRIKEAFARLLGMHGPVNAQVDQFMHGNSMLRSSVGVAGLVIALASATSLTRRLQRLYEVQWSLPQAPMRSVAGRWITWVLAWVAVLATQGLLRAGAGFWNVAGWMASAAVTIGLWWWTPHLLLLGRMPWRHLLPTALVTGGALTVLALGSQLAMPTATGRSVNQYGPFGVVLTLMTWLLVVAGMIVVGAAIGQVLATRDDRDMASSAGPPHDGAERHAVNRAPAWFDGDQEHGGQPHGREQ